MVETEHAESAVKVTSSGIDTLAKQGALIKSLSPLLRVMKLFGSYYDDRTILAGSTGSDHTVDQQRDQKMVAYPTAVLVVLWVNVLRHLFLFNANDEFKAPLINKLTCLAVFVQCAVMQTSYYVASRGGRLARVLNELGVTDELVERCSSLPVCRKSYLHVNSKVDVQAYLWSVMMNQMLTGILFRQFQQFNERFRSSVNQHGRFNGSLKLFRNRHETLRQVVQVADSFMMLSNVSGFACQMFTVIVLLYAFVFIGYSDPVIKVIFLITFISNALGLLVVVFNGMIINIAAHDVDETVHDIDLTTLNTADINDLLMFQKRLTGEPIGFSVLGIFVINKTTMLAILGLLITYFLLVVQLQRSVKMDTCVNAT